MPEEQPPGLAPTPALLLGLPPGQFCLCPLFSPLGDDGVGPSTEVLSCIGGLALSAPDTVALIELDGAVD